MTAWGFLRSIHEYCYFQTREGKKTGAASNGELKRWIQNGALIMNSERVAWDEEMDFPVFSVVLFPNSEKHRTTLL